MHACPKLSCFLIAIIAVITLACLAPIQVSGATLTVLHSFDDGTVPGDGESPTSALIVGADGCFYGTTGGGAGGAGTAFKMTWSGKISLLHTFGDGNPVSDGIVPNGLIQGADGNFYGTTVYGGTSNQGAIFRMTPSGTVTILHSFGDLTVINDGQNPGAGLIQGTDGNFYGTTDNGGEAGNGTVFRITPSGTVTILHSFGDGTVIDDGKAPEAGLIEGSDLTTARQRQARAPLAARCSASQAREWSQFCIPSATAASSPMADIR